MTTKKKKSKKKRSKALKIFKSFLIGEVGTVFLPCIDFSKFLSKSCPKNFNLSYNREGHISCAIE